MMASGLVLSKRLRPQALACCLRYLEIPRPQHPPGANTAIRLPRRIQTRRSAMPRRSNDAGLIRTRRHRSRWDGVHSEGGFHSCKLVFIRGRAFRRRATGKGKSHFNHEWTRILTNGKNLLCLEQHARQPSFIPAGGMRGLGMGGMDFLDRFQGGGFRGVRGLREGAGGTPALRGSATRWPVAGGRWPVVWRGWADLGRCQVLHRCFSGARPSFWVPRVRPCWLGP